VAEQEKKNASVTLDQAMLNSIRQQAQNKKYTFE
jgi:hypothetical protein